MPRRHALADIHDAFRAYFYVLTGLKTLCGGVAPHEDWRQERTELLKFRWSTKTPATLGWHSMGRTSITLYPNATRGTVAETMLHELIHAVDFGADPAYRMISIEGHKKHDEAFWALMTLAAREAFDLPEWLILFEDGQLGKYLDRIGWTLPAWR